MTRSSTFQFAKHYIEMVLVMFAGMFVLGGAILLVAVALGASWGEIRDDAPGVALAGMGLSMTAPMIWWMNRRGHTRAATGTMAAAMLLPTAATIVLLATGTTDDLHGLFMIEHIAMFPAMLVAMLPYRSEYTHAHVEARPLSQAS